MLDSYFFSTFGFILVSSTGESYWRINPKDLLRTGTKRRIHLSMSCVWHGFTCFLQSYMIQWSLFDVTP